MGKKYIIEIPEDKIADFVGSTHFLMPYMMAGHVGHHDTGLPIEPYTEPDLERVRKEAYEKGYHAGYVKYINKSYEDGLKDSWEAARKIIRMPEGDLLDLFDVYSSVCTPVQVMLKYDASEAIEKLNAFEQGQKELGIQGYFKNGEEVIDADCTKAVILRVSEDNYCQVYTEKGCIENWHIHTYKFHKTGRYFPEIATVLEKMREGQE